MAKNSDTKPNTPARLERSAPVIKRRGRKSGGVLKEIDPQGSALDNVAKLALGRTANDPVAELVRTWRSIHWNCEELAKHEQQIGAERIAAAASVSVSDEELCSGKTDKDLEAIRYWNKKRMIEWWLKDEMSKLTWMVRANMELGKARWFRKVAEAIEAEVTADGQDTHPLQAAVLSLFGQLRHTTNQDGVRCYSTDAPLDKTPRHTIGQASKILEDRGHRPPGQSDDDWKRTVRRAFRDVGLLLLPDKPGPKPKKS